MKNISFAVVIFAMVAALGCGGSPTEAPVEEVVLDVVEEQPVVEARNDLVYACSCGPECECGAVALEPGTCGCGSELAQAHLLKMDGNVATLCSCGRGLHL